MPWLVLAMASGFAGDARFDLAVHFGRIAFPYILFISLAALCSGVLNAAGRFTAAAAAPVLLNILFIAALAAAGVMGWPYGPTLAWAVPVAGAAQLGLVWIAAARAGFRLVPRRPRLTPEMRRLARIAAPAMLAGGRGADQPADRPPGGQLFRKCGGLALHCRPALPTAAGGGRDRHRRGAAARPRRGG